MIEGFLLSVYYLVIDYQGYNEDNSGMKEVRKELASFLKSIIVMEEV